MTREDLKNYLLDEDNNGEAWDLLIEIGWKLSGTDSFPKSLSYEKTSDADIFINEDNEEIDYMEYANLLYESIDTVVDSLIEETKKTPAYFINNITDLEFNDMLSEFISSEKKKEMKEKVKKALLEDDRLLQQTLREIDDSDFDKFTVYENEHDTIEHLHERYSEFKDDALNVATQHIDKIADYLVEHYDENFEYYDVVATLLAE